MYITVYEVGDYITLICIKIFNLLHTQCDLNTKCVVVAF